MKNLLLITVFLVVATTKLIAQEGAIEIKGLEKQSSGTIQNNVSATNQDNHQFEIVAKEDVDVNLKFSLKTEGNVNVVVKNKRDRVVYSKKIKKQGENSIAFTMNENEKYTVLLEGNKQSNLIVAVSEN